MDQESINLFSNETEKERKIFSLADDCIFLILQVRALKNSDVEGVA
jgi:hypothetical protein